MPLARLAVVLSLVAFAGCGQEKHPAKGEGDKSGPSSASRDRPSKPHKRKPRPHLARAHCPPSLSNCRTARGTIVYVERVDPDGDGDAHFVLASRQSITGPGISVIDVEKDLRPHPLPGLGDRVSAAGPVYRGSHGQSQIEAIELHFTR